MNVLFDTNVIVDIFQGNEFALHSYAAYDVCVLRGYRPCLSATSLPDLAYLFHARDIATKAQARRLMGDVLRLFRIMDAAECDCVVAYESTMPDYEDALIAHAAQRTGMDVIITRDERHFNKSPVPCMTPTAFVHTFKPKDISYTEIDLAPGE